MSKSWKWTVVIAWLSSWVWAGFAREFAEKWYDLFLVAKDKKQLDTFVKYLKVLYPVTITSKVFDIAKSNQLAQLQREISNIKNIHTFINCIGYAVGKWPKKHKINSWDDILTVYDRWAITLSQATLKLMKKQKQWTIIHVSSLAVLFALDNNPIPAISKIFLWSASADIYPITTDYNITIQSLCPRFITTDAGKKKDMTFKDKAVCVKNIVSTSFNYIKDKKLICIPRRKDKIILTIFNLLPRQRSYSLLKRCIR